MRSIRFLSQALEAVPRLSTSLNRTDFEVYARSQTPLESKDTLRQNAVYLEHSWGRFHGGGPFFFAIAKSLNSKNLRASNRDAAPSVRRVVLVVKKDAT